MSRLSRRISYWREEQGRASAESIFGIDLTPKERYYKALREAKRRREQIDSKSDEPLHWDTALFLLIASFIFGLFLAAAA